MVLLPRGNPVKENVNPGKVNLPAALEKLRQGKFTGYLRFDFSDGTGIFIFQTGQLISARFETPCDNLTAYDAIARTFHEALKGAGLLGIYRLSADMALNLCELLECKPVLQGKDLRQVDIRLLLEKMRNKRCSGCLRVYVSDQSALILYREGIPLGFFRDGSTDVETTADISMSLARQPDARIDVLVCQPGAGQPLTDLMTTASITELWDAAVLDHRRQCEAHPAMTCVPAAREANPGQTVKPSGCEMPVHARALTGT